MLKRKLQKEGFFKVMKMKSTYEKPSERKKRVQTEKKVKVSRDLHPERKESKSKGKDCSR